MFFSSTGTDDVEFPRVFNREGHENVADKAESSARGTGQCEMHEHAGKVVAIVTYLH
jgi:hypothetical protein